MQMLITNAVMATGKNSTNIEISAESMAAFDELLEQLGIAKKKAVMSKVFEWFVALPTPIQRAIILPDKTADEVESSIIAIEYLKKRQEELKTTPPASTPDLSPASLRKLPQIARQAVEAHKRSRRQKEAPGQSAA